MGLHSYRLVHTLDGGSDWIGCNFTGTEGVLLVNLHNISFEEISRIASALEEPEKIEAMIGALERLEKSLHVIRGMLQGKKAIGKQRRKEDQRRRLHLVKKDKDEES